MRFSEDLIEEIRSRNNIVDVIGEHVKLKRTGANYVGLCPFHNERTGSFSVSADKQLYYCFGCHAAGNVITFTMQYQNASFTEALEMLADRAGITIPEDTRGPQEKEREDRKEALLAVYKKAAAFYYYNLRSKAGAGGKAYLIRRGLSEETLRSFGLGYAGKYRNELYAYLKKNGFSDGLLRASGLFSVNEKEGFSDRFFNRVMFPIQDVRGRVIGFGGRVMGDGKPKYLNSPDSVLFNKRMHLFGLNIARIHGRDRILLCEGYMDVISMHQSGFKNAVASLGTSLTEEQANLLRRYTKEVILLYDSDEAGVKAALRAVPILRAAGLYVKVADLRPHKDPDEFIGALGKEAFEERLSKAKNGFLFVIEKQAADYDFTDPQEKTAFEHNTAKELAQIPDELERNNYTEAVCRLYHIPPDSMKRMTGRYAAAGTPAEKYLERKDRSAKEGEKEENANISQKLFLSYLASFPGAYTATKDLIGPEDLTDPFCNTVAKALYAQIGEGSVSEASLVSRFTTLSEQKLAAEIFHTKVDTKTDAARDRAFTDTVLKLLRQSNKVNMQAWNGDAETLTRLMEQKALIERLEKTGTVLHIENGNLS